MVIFNSITEFRNLFSLLHRLLNIFHRNIWMILCQYTTHFISCISKIYLIIGNDALVRIWYFCGLFGFGICIKSKMDDSICVCSIQNRISIRRGNINGKRIEWNSLPVLEPFNRILFGFITITFKQWFLIWKSNFQIKIRIFGCRISGSWTWKSLMLSFHYKNIT